LAFHEAVRTIFTITYHERSIKVISSVGALPQRYLAAILGGASNPNRGAVARDIVDAILVARAEKDKPAVYRKQTEQEERLQAVYEKWAKVAGVWSAAASKAR
jgi:hypothetical protein